LVLLVLIPPFFFTIPSFFQSLWIKLLNLRNYCQGSTICEFTCEVGKKYLVHVMVMESKCVDIFQLVRLIFPTMRTTFSWVVDFLGIPWITAWGPFFFNSLVNCGNVPFTWKDYQNQKLVLLVLIPTFFFMIPSFFPIHVD